MEGIPAETLFFLLFLCCRVHGCCCSCMRPRSRLFVCRKGLAMPFGLWDLHFAKQISDSCIHQTRAHAHMRPARPLPSASVIFLTFFFPFCCMSRPARRRACGWLQRSRTLLAGLVGGRTTPLLTRAECRAACYRTFLFPRKGPGRPSLV